MCVYLHTLAKSFIVAGIYELMSWRFIFLFKNEDRLMRYTYMRGNYYFNKLFYYIDLSGARSTYREFLATINVFLKKYYYQAKNFFLFLFK